MNSLMKKILMLGLAFGMTYDVVNAMEMGPESLQVAGAIGEQQLLEEKPKNLVLKKVEQMFINNPHNITTKWENNGDFQIINSDGETILKFGNQIVFPSINKDRWFNPYRAKFGLDITYPDYRNVTPGPKPLIELEDFTYLCVPGSFAIPDYQDIKGKLSIIESSINDESEIANKSEYETVINLLPSLKNCKLNTDNYLCKNRIYVGNGDSVKDEKNADVKDEFYKLLSKEFNLSQVVNIQFALADKKSKSIVNSYLTLLGLSGDTFHENPFIEYDNTNGQLASQFRFVKDRILGSIVFGRALFYMFFLSRSYGVKENNMVKERQKLKLIYDDKLFFGYDDKNDTFNMCLEKSDRYALRKSSIGSVCDPEDYVKDGFNVSIPVLIEELIRMITVNLQKDYDKLPQSFRETADWLKNSLKPGTWYYGHFLRPSVNSLYITAIFLPALFRTDKDPTDLMSKKFDFYHEQCCNRRPYFFPIRPED